MAKNNRETPTKEMPSTAEAYRRYLKKFDDQETQIEEYQADVKKLQGVERQCRDVGDGVPWWRI